MTIDKAKLKVLAEAATPGRHYDRLESAGGGIKYECTGDDGSLVLKVDHKNDEFGFVGDRGEADEAFFLACSPATILALLAEIERLAADEQEATALCSRLSDLLRDVALAVRGPEEPLKRHGFADLPSRVKAVVAERDQLKAENEDYKSGQERYEQIIDDLKAENEALRKHIQEGIGLMPLGTAKRAAWVVGALGSTPMDKEAQS
ncbi:hypothetical protein [Pseudomonas sp. LP_4_YM]|uniref:hypothetical protein n=1 Tax=Pseudomonas sp. LP_4_YM TaxID=2485135 RepID=UPI00104904F2|nr:hypothetical protein [Pseudomonas sp. LP_4_YM]TCT93306.1 hypothetical protein EC913_116125 [Pseudomonas sp. LP_4_YM]